jgi:4-amino-4-deoxy-L-arabinose transferase-like glycosyltransferase
MATAVERTKGSASGVTSLVLALVALMLLLSIWYFAYVPIPALAALKFGIHGLRPDHSGHGMAIAGLVIAVIALTLFLVIILPPLDTLASGFDTLDDLLG